MGRIRWVGLGAALLVAACTPPPGHSLIDEWPALPEPTGHVPVAATCHHLAASQYAQELVYTLMRVVSCDVRHKSETFLVDRFVGEHASRVSAPPDDGPEMRYAYRQCAEAARTFLGGDWQTARVWLNAFVPSAAAWVGGARWFRCDLAEVDSGANVVKDRTASMRDGLRGTRPLAIDCSDDSGVADSINSVYYTDCGKKHNSEFIGLFTVTPPDLRHPGDAILADRVFYGCWGLAATYVGVRRGSLPRDYSVYYWDFDQDWRRGDQTFRCFLGLTDRSRLIRGGATLRGLGGRPIPYAPA